MVSNRKPFFQGVIFRRVSVREGRHCWYIVGNQWFLWPQIIETHSHLELHLFLEDLVPVSTTKKIGASGYPPGNESISGKGKSSTRNCQKVGDMFFAPRRVETCNSICLFVLPWCDVVCQGCETFVGRWLPCLFDCLLQRQTGAHCHRREIALRVGMGLVIHPAKLTAGTFKVTCFNKENHLNQNYLNQTLMFWLQNVNFQGCTTRLVALDLRWWMTSNPALIKVFDALSIGNLVNLSSARSVYGSILAGHTK